MNYTFEHLGKPHSIVVEKRTDGYGVRVGSQSYAVSNVVWHENVLSCTINSKHYTVFFARGTEGNHLNIDGEYFILTEKKSTSVVGRVKAGRTGDSVSSPMPGLIVKIPVAVGSRVSEGATLAIVEAMKMQNELRAPRDGTVKKVNFREGDQVDALKAIVELE
jgi:biotin carboxyl carrier protein